MSIKWHDLGATYGARMARSWAVVPLRLAVVAVIALVFRWLADPPERFLWLLAACVLATIGIAAIPPRKSLLRRMFPLRPAPNEFKRLLKNNANFETFTGIPVAGGAIVCLVLALRAWKEHAGYRWGGDAPTLAQVLRIWEPLDDDRLGLLRSLVLAAILAAGALWFVFRPLLAKIRASDKSSGIGKGVEVARGAITWASPKLYDRFQNLGDAFPVGPTRSVFLGETLSDDDFQRRYVGLGDTEDLHLLTIATIGAGKSTTAIWPVLGTYAGSMLVMDPKGEHTKKFWRARAGFAWPDGRPGIAGGSVQVLDPFGVCGSGQPSSSYNLLSEVDTSNESEAIELVEEIAKALLPADPSRKDDFAKWEGMARNLIKGLLLVVLAKAEPDERNLVTAVDILLGIAPDNAPVRESKDRLREVLEGMRNVHLFGGIVRSEATGLLELHDGGFSSVLMMAKEAVKWVPVPAMRKNLSSSNFKLKPLVTADYPTTVFVCINDDKMAEYGGWLRAFYGLTVYFARRAGEVKRKLPRLLVVLDELPQYARSMDRLAKDANMLRSSGVRLWAIGQSVANMRAALSAEGLDSLAAVSQIQVFGVNDDETAKWISDKIGKIEAYGSIMANLPQKARLMYVTTSHGAVMRLERRSLETIDFRYPDGSVERWRGLL